MSKVSSLVNKFKSFLAKHASELSILGQGLTVLLNAVGIDPADRKKIVEAINTIEQAGENIQKSLAGFKADVLNVSADDVKEAVLSVLKDNPDMLKEILADMVKKEDAE